MAKSAAGGMKDTLRTWGVYFMFFLPGAAAGGAIGRGVIRPVNWALGEVFRGFNWVFERATRVYGSGVGWCLRLSAIVLLVYVGLIGLTGYGFTRVPSGFIPTQDKGRLVLNVQLPDSASMERTVEVMDKVERIARETPGVAHALSNRGRSFIFNAVSSNLGSAFLPLKPFHERRARRSVPTRLRPKLRQRFRKRSSRGPDRRLRGAGGGRPGHGRRLQTDGGGGRRRQFQCPPGQRRRLGRAGQPAARRWSACSPASAPGRRNSTSTWTALRSRRWAVPLSDVFDALQAYLASFYVNDFNRFGRTWQVNVQADAAFRNDAETVKQLKVRNDDGDMVPLGSVAEVRESAGPVQVARYNMFPAAAIAGAAAAGRQHRRRPRHDGKARPRSCHAT